MCKIFKNINPPPFSQVALFIETLTSSRCSQNFEIYCAIYGGQFLSYSTVSIGTVKSITIS